VARKLKSRVEILTDEIDVLRRQINQSQDMKFIEEFASEVARNAMLLLATKPLEEWPREAIIAFNFAKDKAPRAAQLYLSRLPSTTSGLLAPPK
jgi:hypothetical protein